MNNMRMISLYNPGPHDISNYRFCPEVGKQEFFTILAEQRADFRYEVGVRMANDHPHLKIVDDFDPEVQSLEGIKEKLEGEVKSLEGDKEKLENEVPEKEPEEEKVGVLKKVAKNMKKVIPLTINPEPDVPAKEVHKITCEVCNKVMKSKAGLAVHKRFKH